MYTNALDGLGLKALLYGAPVVAERCFRVSLLEKETTLAPHNEGIIRSAVHLARALDLLGRYGEAKCALRRVIRVYGGDDYEKLLEAVWILACAVEKQGRWYEALTFMCARTHVRERFWGASMWIRWIIWGVMCGWKGN